MTTPTAHQDPLRAPLTADTNPKNWVDAFAPPAAIIWLRLMRADRPIGFWLLFLPCTFGLGLAITQTPIPFFKAVFYIILFAIGAFVMRGAGCVYNDITDRDIDAKVSRTALRPLPSGQIKVKQAVIFLISLCLAGLIVLLQFNATTIILGVGSLGLVSAYPFMKRVTNWPQLWLGLTFNWGVLMGYTAVTGYLTFEALLLYCAGVFWTLGYDTVYAHQDKEDDALIGVKSTALHFADATKYWLTGFYTMIIILFLIVFLRGSFPLISYLALIPAIGHFMFQIRTLDIHDDHKCLSLFKSNRNAGLLLLFPFIINAAVN